MLSPPGNTAKMVTSDLADWVAGLAFSDIPAETISTGKMLLLDSLGCLIAGTTNEAARTVTRAVKRLSSPAEMATVFLTGAKFSARDAALINGVTMYSVGLNGYHKGAMMHPGAAAVPALLAVGEWQNSSGVDVLVALTTGYEVSTRIGRRWRRDISSEVSTEMARSARSERRPQSRA